MSVAVKDLSWIIKLAVSRNLILEGCNDLVEILSHDWNNFVKTAFSTGFCLKFEYNDINKWTATKSKQKLLREKVYVLIRFSLIFSYFEL